MAIHEQGATSRKNADPALMESVRCFTGRMSARSNHNVAGDQIVHCNTCCLDLRYACVAGIAWEHRPEISAVLFGSRAH